MVIFCGKHFYKIINFPGDFFEIKKEELVKFPFSRSLPKKYYWLAKKLFDLVKNENDNYIVISSNNSKTSITADTIATKEQLILERYLHNSTKKIRYMLVETTKIFIKTGITNTNLPKEGDIKWTIRLVP